MMKVKKKNLILATVGDLSLHRHWTKGINNYDTFLIYYGNSNGYKEQSTFYKEAKGYKYHLLKETIDENPWLLEYDYIWLPDDDIYATPEDIDYLFYLMKEYKLLLSQPTIMGWFGVDMNLHQVNSLLRFTNWVEIMCPCFAAQALAVCASVFKENKTGWGIEMLWNVILDHPRDKIAILDDVVVVHTRPVLTGDTYQNKENPLEFAMAEAVALWKKHNLGKEIAKDQCDGRRGCREIFGSVVYRQIKKEFKNIPKQQQLWPKAGFMKKFCEFVKATRQDP